MTDEYKENCCSKCEFCYQIAKHIYRCGHHLYKGKWIAEIEECPKEVLSLEKISDKNKR